MKEYLTCIGVSILGIAIVAVLIAGLFYGFSLATTTNPLLGIIIMIVDLGIIIGTIGYGIANRE